MLSSGQKPLKHGGHVLKFKVLNSLVDGFEGDMHFLLSVSISERIDSVHHWMSLIYCDVEVFSPSQISTGSGALFCF